jgi:hypothetical protein
MADPNEPAKSPPQNVQPRPKDPPAPPPPPETPFEAPTMRRVIGKRRVPEQHKPKP